MSKLIEMHAAFRVSTGTLAEKSPGVGYPMDSNTQAFYAGAAAMAELFATGQGPVLEELRAIRKSLETARCSP